MAKYMVVSRIRADVSFADIKHLAPAEQARSAEFRSQGALLDMYFTRTMDQGFLVFNAENADALQTMLASYPLYPYADWDIFELA